MQELITRAKELLANGTVARVLGWKAGDLCYNPEPAFFTTAEELDNFVYNGFCGANLSKYMIEASKKDGKYVITVTLNDPNDWADEQNNPKYIYNLLLFIIIFVL